MIYWFRIAYGIQMFGLALKMVYYWQFHIWRDLFCHLPIKKNTRWTANEQLNGEEPEAEEMIAETSS